MSEADSRQQHPKKRQRMSVVCLNCKARKIKCDRKRPSCTNCIKCNVGELCRYDPPHWVNKVLQQTRNEAEHKEALAGLVSSFEHSVTPSGSIQDEVTKLRLRIKSLEESLSSSSSSGRAHSGSAGGSGAVGGPGTASSSLLHRSRSRSMSPTSSSSIYGSPSGASGNNHHSTTHDVIDFYEKYSTLVIKRSGIEDHKPLEVNSQWRSDQFVSLLSSYFYLCIKIRSVHDNINKPKPESLNDFKPKLTLDSSVTGMLALLGEQDSPFVKPILDKFYAERIASSEALPAFAVTNPALFTLSSSLKQYVESILPAKPIIRLYLNRFYKYIYPFFPYIDRHGFDKLVFEQLLLDSKDGSTNVVLNIRDKFDYAPTMLLLIFLRFSYVSLLLNINNIYSDDQESQMLLKHPITQNFITVVQQILSGFKFLKKTKLVVIQALFYLRLYLSHCPEDGDGDEMSHSQMFMGLIVQSAFSIGLHRDATNYTQIAEDPEHVNVWRRLWIGILENDRTISPITGNSCIIQNSNIYNVQVPKILENFTPLDHAVQQEYIISQKLYQYYYELANMVNNVVVSPRIDDLINLLKQMNTHLNLNYSLATLTELKDSKNEDVTNFQNVMKIKHNIITDSLTIAVYQHLCLHYESTEHYDFEKYVRNMRTLITTVIQSSTNAVRYLKGEYTPFINPNHYFYLNKLVDNNIMRVVLSLISFLIRLFHTRDLIFTTLKNDFDRVKTIDSLSNTAFRIAVGLSTLHQNVLASSYYQFFKSSMKNKVFLRSLKKEGFRCIKDMITFLAEKKVFADPERKQFLRLSYGVEKDPDSALIKLQNINVFTSYNMEQLENLMKILQTSDILHDPILSSEQSIWNPSFSSISHRTSQVASSILSTPDSQANGSESLSSNAHTNNVVPIQNYSGIQVGNGNFLVGLQSNSNGPYAEFGGFNPNMPSINFESFLNDGLLNMDYFIDPNIVDNVFKI